MSHCQKKERKRSDFIMFLGFMFHNDRRGWLSSHTIGQILAGLL